jgi:hypothetical protein
MWTVLVVSEQRTEPDDTGLGLLAALRDQSAAESAQTMRERLQHSAQAS